MPRNLEFRSTFYHSREMVALSRSPENSLAHKVKKKETPKELTKENNFDVAMMMSKSVVSSFDDEMIRMSDLDISKRLSSVISNAFGTGNEVLTIADSVNLIEKFEFNSANPFHSGVSSKFCLKKGGHKGHMILHIPAFLPVQQLNIPMEATNFKICARLISISNFEKRKNQVRILGNFQHGRYGLYETAMLPVLRIPTEPLTGQLSIPDVGAINDNMSCVLVLGFKFYSYQDCRFRFMPAHGMMKIMKVI